MTDDELKELVASLAIAQRETDRQFKETDRQLRESKLEVDRQFQETNRQFKKTDRQLKETDRQLKELGVQIGGIGNKFGSFTEGLAFPAMEKILKQEFGLERISSRVKSSQDDRTLEIDVLGYSNGENNKVVVVEIKSHLRLRDIEQVLKILEEFRNFFPEYADKQLYGMIAVVDASKETLQKVLDAGLYLGRIHDNQFNLMKSRDFVPRCFH